MSALLLAVCFMSGMMVTDAATACGSRHLLQRADATARAASRIMGVTVALLSLFVAALGLSRRFFPVASSGRTAASCLSAVQSSQWSPSVSCLRVTPSSACLPRPDFPCISRCRSCFASDYEEIKFVLIVFLLLAQRAIAAGYDAG